MNRPPAWTLNPGTRFGKNWNRNLVTFKKIWKVNFITPLLEPMFYILVFGLGFSRMIGNVQYGGLQLSYTQFIAPALIAVAIMYNSLFLFITPMFLFSGTFFPVSNLPNWAQPIALVFPLHHLVELARLFSIGSNETNTILSICYLIVFFLVFSFLALVSMKKRLIN